MKIILASKSPRRIQLLKLLNFNFIVCKSNLDESKFGNNNDPQKFCQELAFLKANEISNKYPEDIVIGGDTIVVINNKILGKPIDKNDAFSILKKLNNKTHFVLTGVSIQCKKDNISHSFYEQTKVTFNKISDDDIKYYIKNYNPFDKAGSYGIQDWSSIFVKKINGCFYNVIGFPISKFYIEFNKLNLNN